MMAGETLGIFSGARAVAEQRRHLTVISSSLSALRSIAARCATAVFLGLVGCQSGQQHLAEPVTNIHGEWMTAFTQSSQEASAGHYAAADKGLEDFALRYPANPDATEASYWRALYRLDPSNPAASTRDAVTLLDGYLALPNTTHRSEAATLRRLATSIDARVAAASTSAAVQKPEGPVVDKAKDEEVAKLKEELAKANAELDRIKRRLAKP